MKNYLIIILIAFTCSGAAQGVVEKQLHVGDYIHVKPCKKAPKGKKAPKEFSTMDIYARTVPMDRSKIDTVTGEGVFEAFFEGSSFDAKRLPCIMGGRKYKIAAMKEVEVKGEMHRVLLCYTSYHLTMIWVELDLATAAGEIDF